LTHGGDRSDTPSILGRGASKDIGDRGTRKSFVEEEKMVLDKKKIVKEHPCLRERGQTPGAMGQALVIQQPLDVGKGRRR